MRNLGPESGGNCVFVMYTDSPFVGVPALLVLSNVQKTDEN